MRLARLHYRSACVRRHAVHQATSSIVQRANVIVLEDLNVKGMLRNHSLARVLSDAALGEFRRQIEYKAKWYGRKVAFADRWYPSTKTCSTCGSVKDMELSERTYKCGCGLVLNRDMNAAINLKHLYRRFVGNLRLRRRERHHGASRGSPVDERGS